MVDAFSEVGLALQSIPTELMQRSETLITLFNILSGNAVPDS